MPRFLLFIIGLFLACALSLAALAQDEQNQPPPITAKDIISYLEQVVTWQRQILALGGEAENARQIYLHDALKDRSRKITQHAFEFARAEAATVKDELEVADDTVSEEAARRQRLRKAANALDDQVRALNKQLGQVADRLRQSPSGQRAALSAERERILNELQLARAQQALIGTMIGIFNSADDKEGLTLGGRINRLARSLEDEQDHTDTSSDYETGVKLQPSQDMDGMFRQIKRLLELARRQQAVETLIEGTEALRARNSELVDSLRVDLRKAIEEGKAISQKKTGSVDAVLEKYKRLAGALIPLGQMSVAINISERYLKEWQALIEEEWKSLFKRLSFRLILLGIAILIPWGISEITERAIARYVHDSRRRRQLQILRRVALGFVLALIILVNFVTEFGSLATFAGFLTAGLAVALQTVLVSLVAHFFFFGRFGVRAGDRVTVAGVTGDVIQVGMLRLYLRELDKEADFKPTGKVVAFPNSILFQPSAFYKHMDE